MCSRQRRRPNRFDTLQRSRGLLMTARFEMGFDFGDRGQSAASAPSVAVPAADDAIACVSARIVRHRLEFARSRW